VLAALSALAGLTACTPAARPLTAVRMLGNLPTVLLAACSDFQIDSISLYPDSGDATVAAGGPDRRLERSGSEVPADLPIFGSPPPGWVVASGRLTALAPGQKYGLAGYAHARPTVPITFTAEDLAALGAGEVLVGKRPGSHQKVTEREFRKRAKDSC
jgi:hypothetical protein